jgi:hypothetical protein
VEGKLPVIGISVGGTPPVGGKTVGDKTMGDKPVGNEPVGNELVRDTPPLWEARPRGD